MIHLGEICIFGVVMLALVYCLAVIFKPQANKYFRKKILQWVVESENKESEDLSN